MPASRQAFAAGEGGEADGEIFHDREMREDVAALRHVADAGAGAAMGGGGGDIRASQR